MSEPVNTFEAQQLGRPTGPLVQGYEVVIGFETHAQLSTQSKIFSRAPTAFGAEPNTQACAVDLALPGMSVPAGFGEGGMPVGVQLIGNYLKEGQLLNVAHRLQQVTDFHLLAPSEFA